MLAFGAPDRAKIGSQLVAAGLFGGFEYLGGVTRQKSLHFSVVAVVFIGAIMFLGSYIYRNSGYDREFKLNFLGTFLTGVGLGLTAIGLSLLGSPQDTAVWVTVFIAGPLLALAGLKWTIRDKEPI